MPQPLSLTKSPILRNEIRRIPSKIRLQDPLDVVEWAFLELLHQPCRHALVLEIRIVERPACSILWNEKDLISIVNKDREPFAVSSLARAPPLHLRGRPSLPPLARSPARFPALTTPSSSAGAAAMPSTWTARAKRVCCENVQLISVLLGDPHNFPESCRTIVPQRPT